MTWNTSGGCVPIWNVWIHVYTMINMILQVNLCICPLKALLHKPIVAVWHCDRNLITFFFVATKQTIAWSWKSLTLSFAEVRACSLTRYWFPTNSHGLISLCLCQPRWVSWTCNKNQGSFIGLFGWPQGYPTLPFLLQSGPCTASFAPTTPPFHFSIFFIPLFFFFFFLVLPTPMLVIGPWPKSFPLLFFPCPSSL